VAEDYSVPCVVSTCSASNNSICFPYSTGWILLFLGHLSKRAMKGVDFSRCWPSLSVRGIVLPNIFHLHRAVRCRSLRCNPLIWRFFNIIVVFVCCTLVHGSVSKYFGRMKSSFWYKVYSFREGAQICHCRTHNDRQNTYLVHL
jgi:hypothetical protein